MEGNVVRTRPRVSFELADDADDGELRQLLRESPMQGRIDLAFLREPSYFRAAGIAGNTVQTLVARVRGRMAGVATRALRTTSINGHRVEAGYLGDLRLRPEFRGRTILARGYRFLRELHRDGRAEIYSTVIVASNQAALNTIAANRADLPRYTDQGRFLTPMIHLGRGRKARASEDARRAGGVRDAEIERGTLACLPEIVEKLNENRLQFAPIWTEADFLGGRLPGFRIEDFYLLRRDGRLAGVMGVWDQRSFRQTVVLGYHGLLGKLRPLVNLVRRSVLPAPGEPLSFFYVAFVSTDDVAAFRTLLARVYDSALGRGYTHFVVGLHERDPRTVVFDEFPQTPFAGRLFSVTFDGSPELDGRVPYMEAALL